MTSKANLPNRVQKAKAASYFARILSTDPRGRARLVEVPGSEGGRYTVELNRWDAYEQIQIRCRKNAEITEGQQWDVETADFVSVPEITGGEPCKGNANGTVCYHGMAAIIKAAEGNGEVKFCANEADVTRLANLGGKVVNLAGEGTGKVWVVMLPKTGTHPTVPRDAWQKRDQAMPVTPNRTGKEVWEK